MYGLEEQNPAKIDIKKLAQLQRNVCMLQYNQDKFSHKENAEFCKICKDGDEDIEHFILKCKPLDEVRQNYLKRKIYFYRLY